MALFQTQVEKRYLSAITADIPNLFTQYESYFKDPERQTNIREIKEEQFQGGFVDALFVKLLGYTLYPNPNYNFIREQKNETDSKSADGAIVIEGKTICVVELKDHKTQDLKKVETQAFGYKNNHKGCRYIITSNFERLRFYIDNAVEFIEFDLFNLNIAQFKQLWLCLSFESISNDIPLKIKSESISSEDQITKFLYKDYSEFKRALFNDIVAHNLQFDKLLLFQKTQKLLDRFLFVFFAEDKGLLPPNSVKRIIDQWDKRNEDPLNEYQPLYRRFRLYFNYLNEGHKGAKEDIFGYNGGLFRVDNILESIEISDDVIKTHALKLIKYDFDTEVDVNILGHIFENSLTEIEEITNEITTGQKSVSKRKQDGVFYTPRYITKYIVENTVGKLCEDKKAELGINEELFGFTWKTKKEAIAKKTEAIAKFDDYREWLLGLTICDPACGSGAFLNMALEFLMAEHHWIAEQKDRIYEDEGKKKSDAKQQSMIELYDIENVILENNLYGVDINEESIEIAKLALWLHTAKPMRKLTTLSNNIKCGNSLISDPEVAGDKAFDWQKEFPQVFAKGGFDVVVGNPPYVSAIDLKKAYTENEYKYIKDNYLTAKGTVDLYIYFFERGLHIIKEKGILSYITPNRYLSASYGSALRSYILETSAILQIVNYSDKKVFPDASTYPVISFLRKDTIDHYEIICGKFDDTTKELVFTKVESEKLTLLDDNIWGFLLNDKLTISQKVIKQCISLSNVGEINATSTAKEADDYSPIINETDGCKLINTGTIDPYTNTWGFEYLVNKGDKYLTPHLPLGNLIISENRRRLYNSRKIIIAKIGLRCEAFLDLNGEFASINTNCIHSFKAHYSPEYIICWLNSRLYNYIYECLFDGLRMSGGYLLYSAPNLHNTYILEIAHDKQEPFAPLAQRMARYNELLLQNQHKFLKRLKGNIENLSITTKLSHFYRLDFGLFLRELSKQKIKLSLKQQDEWEEYFNESVAECKAIADEINKTDAEINKMVYGLYGLTPEEIENVEKSI